MSDKRQKLSFRKSIGGVIISLLIAVGLLSIFIEGDFQELARTVLKAKVWLIAFAVCLFFVEVGTWTGRWKVALKAVNRDIGFGSLYWICHGGKFVTNVTPLMKAGGDPFRAYFANKIHNLPYDIGLGTLLAESVIGIPVFLFFLTIGAFTWLYLTTMFWIALLVGILLGLSVLFFLPFTQWLIRRGTAMDFLARLISWINERMGGEDDDNLVNKSLRKFYKSTQFVVEHKKASFYMLSLSFITYFITLVRFYVIFLALGLEVAWYVPLLGATLPFLLGLIPFSPGGLIFVEGGMVALFTALGIPPTLAVSFVILERGISYFISTVAGGVVTSYLGLKIWKR